MLTKAPELVVVPPYGLRVRFNNGQAGIHDCSKLVPEPGSDDRAFARPGLFRACVPGVWRSGLAERLRHVARMAAPGDAGRRRTVGERRITPGSGSRAARCIGRHIDSRRQEPFARLA